MTGPILLALALPGAIEAMRTDLRVRPGTERRDVPASLDRTPIFGVFTGSTPCETPIRSLLNLRSGMDAHLMEWKLTLYEAPEKGASANYHLIVSYGPTTPGRPGLAPRPATLERRGSWRPEKRAAAQGSDVVYRLGGSVDLVRISEDILHVLESDRSLMVGNGGWSYTLNREEGAEQRLDPLLATAVAESRTLSPVAAGPSVYGVFEGRTPCQGIARELNIPAPDGCAKVKWRITLFHDPDARNPTTYKVESGLHRAGIREGNWTVLRGIGANPQAVVYRLEPAGEEPALFLLRGDDNVLFVMDGRMRPLTGHRDFSYTLNRRAKR